VFLRLFGDLISRWVWIPARLPGSVGCVEVARHNCAGGRAALSSEGLCGDVLRGPAVDVDDSVAADLDPVDIPVL
jgi:hypothetical protein